MSTITAERLAEIAILIGNPQTNISCFCYADILCLHSEVQRLGDALEAAEAARDTAIKGMSEYAQRLGFLESVVREMRESQKQYFRTRGQDALNKSKRLERQIDDTLKEATAMEKQGSLL